MLKIFRILIVTIFLLSLAAPALAQGAEYQVHAQREFGYGNGGDVRGNFALTVYGNQDTIQSVTYLLDGQEMATLHEPPFKFPFQTGSYPDGVHALAAVVSTQDGRTVKTPEIRLNFLSREQESQSAKKIIIPILSVALLAVLFSVGAQFLAFRRGGNERLAPGAPRSYGFKGGTICPRCGRAYSIHFFSINLVGGCFDRCDFCGKWAFVRARSQAELEQAVRAEAIAVRTSESSLPAVQSNRAETEEERLRRTMEDSKYVE
jgi:hypothetical protein